MIAVAHQANGAANAGATSSTSIGASVTKFGPPQKLINFLARPCPIGIFSPALPGRLRHRSVVDCPGPENSDRDASMARPLPNDFSFCSLSSLPMSRSRASSFFRSWRLASCRRTLSRPYGVTLGTATKRIHEVNDLGRFAAFHRGDLLAVLLFLEEVFQRLFVTIFELSG